MKPTKNPDGFNQFHKNKTTIENLLKKITKNGGGNEAEQKKLVSALNSVMNETVKSLKAKTSVS